MRKAARQATKSKLITTDVREVSIAKPDSGRELMQAVLAKPRKTETFETSKDKHITGIVIGTLSEASKDGQPMVYYPGIPTGNPLPATLTTNLSHHKSGQEVALGFVDGDPALPIILGLIQKPGKQEQSAVKEATEDQVVNVKIDGDRLTLSAEHEIVLQCGKSSITLTRAGKVILKGAYLSTHSTGVNRIKGGSVQIN
jgi:hypothetical protein